jgi:excisionase family DNA binding protein
MPKHYETRGRDPRLLSVEDLAKRLGVGRKLVHRWAREGAVPAQRWGRRYVFALADIEALLEGRRHVGASDGKKTA